MFVRGNKADMPTTIAVIADLHLPDGAGSPQRACLDWAVNALIDAQPDVVVVAGDVTACGSPQGARQVRQALARTGLKLLIIPGNSDRRRREHYDLVQRELQTPRVFANDECSVLAVDTAAGTLSDAQRQAMEAALNSRAQRALAVVMHHYPESLSDDSRRWLLDWLERAGPCLLVCGHKHYDTYTTYELAEIYTVRGLDPDKAREGPPSVTLFDLAHGVWTRRDISYQAGTPAKWSNAERAEFGNLLGISCMSDPLGGLEFVTTQRVRCVELRSNAADVARKELNSRVAAWRDSGGQWLSWHMPDLSWDEVTQKVTGTERWSADLEVALALGAQQLTVHVPRVRADLMVEGSTVWRSFSDLLCKLSEPAINTGLFVGIENLHMRSGDAPDGSRQFGCLPDECRLWIEELRRRLDPVQVGFCLDVGHARNNLPFSDCLSIGQWYTLMGRETVGYHIHQVTKTEGGMSDHHPLRQIYGGGLPELISYSSFLFGWHTGLLNHRPIFLEIRGDTRGRAESFKAIWKQVVEFPGGASGEI